MAILLGPQSPGPSSVGGQIQSAVITKDGFRWGKRPPKLAKPQGKRHK
jgi:hypothetical protein